jgi:5'-nucleotidase
MTTEVKHYSEEAIAENIALFDLDQTLCDYDAALKQGMLNLRAPEEGPYEGVPRDDAPSYLRARANLLRASAEWWATLPKLQLGFDIWKLAGDLGYRRMILSAGPKRNANAWAGKKMWIDRNIGDDVDITITRDKGLVYGRVLVDDWPDYIIRWLEWRPRGLVIMPATKNNETFKHKQAIRYNGTNLNEAKEAMVNLFVTPIERI